MAIDKTTEVDFSALDEESRSKLHRVLYRQECRAWLLWAALAIWGIASSASSEKEHFKLENELIGVLVIMYSCYISFWVIYPTHKFLIQFRSGDEVKRKYGFRIFRKSGIESKFDDSFASLWDFFPSLLLPVLGYLLILLLRIVYATN